MVSASAPSGAAHPRTPPLLAAPDGEYLWMPQRLLDELYDSPLAVGVYCVIARRWLAYDGPTGVPLSDGDFIRYDPHLGSRGAFLRALHRLQDGNWLVTERSVGRKTRYIPSWGQIRGVVRPWSKSQPSLGRGRVKTIRVDRLLLDDYIGRLIPHPKAPAQIDRYVTSPQIGLRDVGIYVLRLRQRTTPPAPALEASALCHDQVPLALPTTEETLQRAELSYAGLQRVGLAAPRPCPRPRATDTRPPLFLVAPHLIPHLILHPILPGASPHPPFMGIHRDETALTTAPLNVTGTQGIQGIDLPPPPHISHQHDGGLSTNVARSPSRLSTGDKDTDDRLKSQTRSFHHPPSPPDSPSARRLQALGVRPRQMYELADLPLATIEAAIRDGTSRPKVYDLAGWVVSMLRDVRDHGWDLALARRGSCPSNAGMEEAELQIVIAKARASGMFTTDATLEARRRVAVPDRDAHSSGSSLPQLSAPDPEALNRDDQAPAPASVLVHCEVALPDLADMNRSSQPCTAREADVMVVPPGCPPWIAPDIWAALSPMLRGILRDAHLDDGQIVAADRWRQQQVDRLAAELHELLRRG